jgi:hypothetical protein
MRRFSIGRFCEPLIPVDEQPADVIANGFQLDDAIFDFAQPVRGQRPRLPARRSAVLSLLQKRRELVERESEVEGAANDADAIDDGGRKAAIPVREPLRFGDHAFALVMPDRVRADSADARHVRR